MRRILADVWHRDLNVVQAEFANAGVNHALDQSTGLARHLPQHRSIATRQSAKIARSMPNLTIADNL
jgi:hypothetical protein